MLCDEAGDEAAARRDLHAPRTRLLQCRLHDLPADAALAQMPRHFGMREEEHAIGAAVVHEGNAAVDVELEAGEGGVVANGRRHERNMGTARTRQKPHLFDRSCPLCSRYPYAAGSVRSPCRLARGAAI